MSRVLRRFEGCISVRPRFFAERGRARHTGSPNSAKNSAGNTALVVTDAPGQAAAAMGTANATTQSANIASPIKSYQSARGNSPGSNRWICAEGIDRLLISGRGCEMADRSLDAG
jgi:hypothetical protein